jgi:hypothetical protein
MTHKDSGKYVSKHPSGAKLNKRIAEIIREKSTKNGLACGMAEMISKELGVEMAEVGTTADLLEIKIIKCQLGLFGYGDKPEHGKYVKAADSVSGEMEKALDDAADNGRVTCAALWSIADKLGVRRRETSAACDTLKLKIHECQLGAF